MVMEKKIYHVENSFSWQMYDTRDKENQIHTKMLALYSDLKHSCFFAAKFNQNGQKLPKPPFETTNCSKIFTKMILISNVKIVKIMIFLQMLQLPEDELENI